MAISKNDILAQLNLDLDIVKPVLSGHSKIDKTKVLKTNDSCLKDKWQLNEGRKYCRMLFWSILQYF